MQSYPIGMILPVPGSGRLVLFEAYPTRDVIHREIWGREVFLFDAGNRPVWQIAPEPGATDDMHGDFDATRPATDTFSPSAISTNDFMRAGSAVTSCDRYVSTIYRHFPKGGKAETGDK